MKENNKEDKELTEEQEKAIKELIKLIDLAHKKEIQEKEIIITNMQTRGKRVTIR